MYLKSLRHADLENSDLQQALCLASSCVQNAAAPIPKLRLFS